MKSKNVYPSREKIIELNLLALALIKVKKADKAQVLSHSRIQEVVDECREIPGDIYDKSVVLMKGLIQKHPFASGNRRTAFLTVKYFLLHNKAKLKINGLESQAKVMQGIRENYYSNDEIKEWIKNGKIRQFKREI